MDFSLNSSETADTRVLKQCRPISELGEDQSPGGLERTGKLARTSSATFSSRQAENLTGGAGNGVSTTGASVDDHHQSAAAASQLPVAHVYDPLISASLYQHQLGGVRSLGYGQQYGMNPMKQVSQFGSVGFQQQYYPFTASQWAELEHQALIFKYMMARAPVPPELVTPFRRSLILSPSTNSFQLGVSTGSPMDAEPGRCRRTDGKKWRCAKPIVADQKYCERHIHRGRNRSRKAAEAAAAAAAQAASTLSTGHLAASLPGSNPVHHGNGNGNGNSVGYDHKSSSNGSKMFFTGSSIESGLSSGYPIQHQSSDSALHSKEPRFVNGMSKDQFDFRPEQLLFSEVSGSCTRNLGEYRTSTSAIPSGIPSQTQIASYGYESMIDNSNNNNNNNSNAGASALIRGAEQRKQPEALRHFFVDWPRKSEGSWCEEESKEGLLKLALENANSANSSEDDHTDPYTNISLARIAGAGGDLLADVLKSGSSPRMGNPSAGKPPHVGFNVANSSSQHQQQQQQLVLSSPTGVLQKVTCFSDSSSSASSPGSVKTETSHGAAH